MIDFMPYDQQMAELQRRQRMAQMLQDQAMQPLESQVAPGGMVVPTSPVLGLAQLLKSYMGGKAQAAVGKETAAAKQRARDEFGRFIEQTSPEAAPAPDMTLSQGDSPVMAPQTTPAQMRQRLIQGLASGNPIIEQYAQTMLAQKPEREEYGTTPVQGADGRYYLVSKSGNLRQTDVSAPAAKPESVPSAVKEYNFAVQQGFKGTFTDYQQQMGRAGATNVTTSYGAPVAGVDENGKPVYFQPSKEGGKPAIIPGVRPEGKPPNEQQAHAAGFARRLMEANANLESAAYSPTISKQALSAMPFTNTFLEDAQQRAEQAQREFINAQLRRESGAAIGQSEFDNAQKQYFPQPGDKPAVLEQKRKARQTAIENMRSAAGNAASVAPVASVAPPSPALSNALAIYGLKVAK
jgi:hypothetical protein